MFSNFLFIFWYYCSDCISVDIICIIIVVYTSSVLFMAPSGYLNATQVNWLSINAKGVNLYGWKSVSHREFPLHVETKLFDPYFTAKTRSVHSRNGMVDIQRHVLNTTRCLCGVIPYYDLYREFHTQLTHRHLLWWLWWSCFVSLVNSVALLMILIPELSGPEAIVYRRYGRSIAWWGFRH